MYNVCAWLREYVEGCKSRQNVNLEFCIYIHHVNVCHWTCVWPSVKPWVKRHSFAWHSVWPWVKRWHRVRPRVLPGVIRLALFSTSPESWGHFFHFLLLHFSPFHFLLLGFRGASWPRIPDSSENIGFYICICILLAGQHLYDGEWMNQLRKRCKIHSGKISPYIYLAI